MLNIIIAPKKKNDRFMDIETMGGTPNIMNVATFVIGIDVGNNMAEVLKIRNPTPYIKQGIKFSADMIPFIVDCYLKYSLE
jgi:hypothetical protein